MLTKLRGYPVRVRRFELAGRSLEILGPANFEALVDDPRVVQRFERDEFMPYWAEFWPACLLLADEVAKWPSIPRSPDAPLVLELGAGLGLVSLLAAALGYRVIASDYEDDALAFIEASATRSGVPTPELRFIDWRERYPGLRPQWLLAAEVLYEPRNLAPIAGFIAEHLHPEGAALIVDRNRSTADRFPQVAHEAGLTVAVQPVERTDEKGETIRGRLFEVRRAN